MAGLCEAGVELQQGVHDNDGGQMLVISAQDDEICIATFNAAGNSRALHVVLKSSEILRLFPVRSGLDVNHVDNSAIILKSLHPADHWSRCTCTLWLLSGIWQPTDCVDELKVSWSKLFASLKDTPQSLPMSFQTVCPR